MSTALSAFLPYVRPDVPGCPEIMVEQAILSAIIEFCEKTLYWKYEHGRIATAQNIKNYRLSLPAGSQLATVLEPITQDDEPVWQRTRQWLDNNYNQWQIKTGKIADYYMVMANAEIRLVPYPDQLTYLDNITVALKPTPGATTVDDVIYNEHFEAISHGAKAKLMEQPDKGWSNPSSAVYFKGLFEQAKADARAKAKAGYKTQDTINRVKAHIF